MEPRNFVQLYWFLSNNYLGMLNADRFKLSAGMETLNGFPATSSPAIHEHLQADRAELTKLMNELASSRSG